MTKYSTPIRSKRENRLRWNLRESSRKRRRVTKNSRRHTKGKTLFLSAEQGRKIDFYKQYDVISKTQFLSLFDERDLDYMIHTNGFQSMESSLMKYSYDEKILFMNNQAFLMGCWLFRDLVEDKFDELGLCQEFEEFAERFDSDPVEYIKEFSPLSKKLMLEVLFWVDSNDVSPLEYDIFDEIHYLGFRRMLENLHSSFLQSVQKMLGMNQKIHKKTKKVRAALILQRVFPFSMDALMTEETQKIGLSPYVEENVELLSKYPLHILRRYCEARNMSIVHKNQRNSRKAKSEIVKFLREYIAKTRPVKETSFSSFEMDDASQPTEGRLTVSPEKESIYSGTESQKSQLTPPKEIESNF